MRPPIPPPRRRPERLGDMLELFDVQILSALLPLADNPHEVPEPEDVKAGWTALAIWLTMAVVVGLLGWSMLRRLKGSLKARDEGVYGDPRPVGKAPQYEDEDEDEARD